MSRAFAQSLDTVPTLCIVRSMNTTSSTHYHAAMAAYSLMAAMGAAMLVAGVKR